MKSRKISSFVSNCQRVRSVEVLLFFFLFISLIGDQVNVRESRIGDIRQRQKRMAGSEKRREIEGGKRLEKFTMHFFPCKITRFTESAKVSNILEELERVTLEQRI